MRHENKKTWFSPALTLIEMVISLAIMAILVAVLVPQLRAIQNSWDSNANSTEALQNGRILIDHLNRNLSKAARITAVSDSSTVNGYIEFTDNDAKSFRYDVNAISNYVEFDLVGSLSDLAGPVSQFQFTCYDGNDFDTAITDANSIRFVKVQTTITNSASSGRDITLSTQVYLRTTPSSELSELVGWWKLDETSGDTAADSSGFENDGSLENMSGNEWTVGILNGALEFDGVNNYSVDCGKDAIFDITDEITLSVWIKPNDCGNSDHNPYVVKGDYSYGLKHTASNNLEFYIKIDGGGWYLPHYSVSGSFNGEWHHVAGTYDGSQVKLYVDGALEDYIDCAGPIETDSSHVCIGEEYDRTYRYYDGLIDDVRIYNRALEPEDIAALANILRFIDFTEAKAASETTSITISTPGTSEGDLLIAAVATDGYTPTSITPPFGEGWSEIDIDDFGNEITLGAWWKLADASESPSHQFTWSGDQQAYGWMMHFTGHDSSDPIHDYSTDGESSSTPDSPEVTTTVDNCLILRLGAFDDDDITVNDPGLSGHTAITMDYSASTGGQVQYESSAEASASSDTTSINVSKPSGTVQGDLLIANFVSDGSSTLSAPGGWTLVEGGGVNPVDNTPSFGVWYKIAGASEPSNYTFTSSASEELYIAVLRYTGHDPSAPINASDIANSSGSTTPTAPTVTTTVDNCKILRVFGADDDDDPYVSPGGHTERYNGQSGGGYGTCGGAGADTDQASAGATGTAAFSQQNSEEWRAVTVAIAPAIIVVGGTVSGGAGYVSQQVSGDSGTSEFSLGSSNQAQTLTIAIAPDNQDSFSGGGISP